MAMDAGSDVSSRSLRHGREERGRKNEAWQGGEKQRRNRELIESVSEGKGEVGK